ncbi:MAG TPA: hypothetical protein PLH19_00250 [Anaerolineae bacterium]|nr:hypothetical protein [Anaerolineae bacterium]HQH36952.1 hypothetical protein [Anaerolineae bacterium]
MAGGKIFLDALIDQQRDPVAFLHGLRCYRRRLWWPAWGIRAGAWAALSAVLGIIAWLTPTKWDLLLAPILILPLMTQILCALLITILGEAQFWLLYAYSPLLILMGWLWGLGSLSPLGTWLGLQVGFIFYVGKLIADGCTMWVHRQLEEVQDEQQRHRGTCLPITATVMPAWQRARKIRVWAAVGLSVVILYIYHALPAQELCGYSTCGEEILILHAIISVGAGMFGCLGLDATLLAILKAKPALCFTAGQWQPTYIGRVALWTPMRYIHRLFLSERALSDQSYMMCTLLTQGYLGPVVRRVCRSWSAMHLQQLLVALSMQEGGSAVIRYLLPSLPPSLQTVGAFYAHLADEALKPPDLQCWLHVLTAYFPSTIMPDDGFETSAILLLSQVRDALLTVTATPELTQTLRRMCRLITQWRAATLLSETTSTPSWPSMLLWRLEQHQKRLQII